MTEIELDGKKYVTTKRAAEITKYSKDYIGQLARSGKINARLVGRSWYIDAESILAHKDSRDSNEDHLSSIHVETSDSLHPEYPPHNSPTAYYPKYDELRTGESVDSAHESISYNLNNEIVVPDSNQPINNSSIVQSAESAGGDAASSPERKVTGSSGWRSLWGVPVYESEESDLLPVPRRRDDIQEDVMHHESESLPHQEVGGTHEEGNELHADMEVRSPDNSASLKSMQHANHFYQNERVRLTLSQRRGEERLEINNSVKSNLALKRLLLPVGLSVLVVGLLAIGYSTLIASNSAREGAKSRFGGGIFSDYIHYKR